MFAQPLPVISEESMDTSLIEGRKFILKTKNNTATWQPVPFKFKVFTNKEIGWGSTCICYEALGESGRCTRKMVAKQLIKVNNKATSPFTSYLETKQTYIAVAKYLKKFQQASELIKGFKGCEYELDAISDLKVGNQSLIFIVITWVCTHQLFTFYRLSIVLWHTTSLPM